MIILNDKEKVDFFVHETIHEIKDILRSLGLPVSGSRRTVSIRLYNAVYEDFWSEEE